jgi:hypothetical protein
MVCTSIAMTGDPEKIDYLGHKAETMNYGFDDKNKRG